MELVIDPQVRVRGGGCKGGGISGCQNQRGGQDERPEGGGDCHQACIRRIGGRERREGASKGGIAANQTHSWEGTDGSGGGPGNASWTGWGRGFVGGGGGGGGWGGGGGGGVRYQAVTGAVKMLCGCGGVQVTLGCGWQWVMEVLVLLQGSINLLK